MAVSLGKRRLMAERIFTAQATEIVDESKTRAETIERIVAALLRLHDTWFQELSECVADTQLLINRRLPNGSDD